MRDSPGESSLELDQRIGEPIFVLEHSLGCVGRGGCEVCLADEVVG